MKKRSTSGLVYSTETGRLCPGCGKSPKECSCKQTASRPAADGIVRISRQTKGRKGSGVSLISGLTLTDSDLKKLAKALKQQCGSGGTIKDGVIEIQGDHRETLRAALQKAGFNVKLAGG